MKFSQLSDLTLDELSVKGRSLRQELFNLKLQKATAQLEKPTRMRTLRKDIARVVINAESVTEQAPPTLVLREDGEAEKSA